MFIGFLTPLLILFSIYLPSRNNKEQKLLPVPIYDKTSNIENSNLYLKILNLRKNKYFNLNDKTDTMLFVNFWATWCKPCIAEMPSMVILQQKLKNYPITFLLITNEPKDKIVNFYTKKKYFNFDFCVSNEKTPSLLDGNSLPRTYIIYKNKIIYEHIGTTNWDSEDVINLVKKQF